MKEFYGSILGLQVRGRGRVVSNENRRAGQKLFTVYTSVKCTFLTDSYTKLLRTWRHCNI